MKNARAYIMDNPSYFEYLVNKVENFGKIDIETMTAEEIAEIEKENQDGHNNFLYPVGKIDKMNMYPLTFNEFLFAYKPTLYSLLENSFLEEKELISHLTKIMADDYEISDIDKCIEDIINSYTKDKLIRKTK